MTVLVKRHTLKRRYESTNQSKEEMQRTRKRRSPPIVDNENSIFEPTKNLNTIANQVAFGDSVNFYGRIGDSMTSDSGAILKIDDERGRRGARNKIEPVCL